MKEYPNDALLWALVGAPHQRLIKGNQLAVIGHADAFIGAVYPRAVAVRLPPCVPAGINARASSLPVSGEPSPQG